MPGSRVGNCGSSDPIQNSPPGIQTIPTGAGFGAGEVFSTVAMKPDNVDGVVVCCAEIFGVNRHAERAKECNKARVFNFERTIVKLTPFLPLFWNRNGRKPSPDGLAGGHRRRSAPFASAQGPSLGTY